MFIFLSFFYMSYQNPSSFMCSKHLLVTNITSVFRHSKNNCARVHPFPKAFCKMVSLWILGELISTCLCVWLSEKAMNKIQAKICDVYGKPDRSILFVSTGNCNLGWEAVAPGYLRLFSGINRDKVLQGVCSRSKNTESHAKDCTIHLISLLFLLLVQIHGMP